MRKRSHGQGASPPLKSHGTWYTPMIVEFLRDDVPRILGLPGCLVARDVTTLERRLANEGESFLLITLPVLGKAIDLALQGHVPLQTSAFKNISRRCALPRFLGGLLRRVFRDDGYIRDEPCIRTIRLLRQLCFWCGKLERRYRDEVLQSSTDEFRAVDAALPATRQELCVAGRLLAVAKSVVDLALSNIDGPINHGPKHGTGAVASGGGAVRKRHLDHSYTDLEKVFRPIPWFASWRDVAEDHTRITGRFVCKYGLDRLAFVIKTVTDPRLICLTEAEYQWVQQSIMACMYNHLERVSLFRGHVNFTNQERNREMALDWSTYDTLDMSKASDRNSLAVFNWLFADTRIYRELLASRSPGAVLPDGTIVWYKKFAPMGSATCFPVQALTYYALACAALHLAGMPISLALKKIYVYGDDLIVPHGYFSVIDEAFTSVGMKFNPSKCCTHGRFRESCGMDAYDGIEVTPIRFRKSIYTDQLQLVSIIEHCNQLARRNYWSAAKALRNALYKAYPFLKTMGLPQSPRADLPFLYWQVQENQRDTVRYKAATEDRACPWPMRPFLQKVRVKGWSTMTQSVVLPAALEVKCLRESLSRAGPVGELVYDPVTDDRPHVEVERSIGLRYSAGLRKSWFDVEPAHSVELAMDGQGYHSEALLQDSHCYLWKAVRRQQQSYAH